MTYLKQNLGTDEHVLVEGHYHWMYTASALLGLILSGAFSIWIYTSAPAVLQPPLAPGLPAVDRVLAVVIFGIGAFRYLSMMIIKMTTEVAVTNYRLVFKRGLISRRVESVNVDRIEGADLTQTVLGRIFGFGRVQVRGVGVDSIRLPQIADPVKFRMTILEASTYYRRA